MKRNKRFSGKMRPFESHYELQTVRAEEEKKLGERDISVSEQRRRGERPNKDFAEREKESKRE